MRNRKHFAGAWLNDVEYQHLERLCKTSGLTTSVLLRKLILEQYLSPHPPEVYAKLLRELSAIGNNINQLACWANTRKSVSEQELQEAIQLIRKGWELLKDGL